MRMLLLATAAWLAWGAAQPVAADTLSPDQKRAVEGIVRDYLLKNPEILDDVLRALQEKREAAERERRRAAMVRLRDALVNDPATPVAGNPEGDVTVVEFFDYRCQYCQQSLPTILHLLEADGKVRFAFKDFPILGAPSVFAARATLAAWALDRSKYMAFHSALMQAKGDFGEAEIMALAAAGGYDAAALRKGMADPAIAETLERNFALAEELRISGTPAFVIGRQFVPGAVNLETLKRLVAEARKD